MVSVMDIAGADFRFEATYADRSCGCSNGPMTAIEVIETSGSTGPREEKSMSSKVNIAAAVAFLISALVPIMFLLGSEISWAWCLPVRLHGEFRRITGHSVDAKKAKQIRAGRFLPWTATRTDVCERASGETPVRETVDFKRELDKDFDIWPARGCG